MPKRFLKKYMPSEKTLRENKYLRVFGQRIFTKMLWHLNKRSVSGAFTVGLFCAFIPVPFQMVLAAGGAVAAKVNLPISIGLVWITNPITMPPIFYFAYLVGAWTMGTPTMDVEFSLSYEWIESTLGLIWKPFLLGCFICGIVAAFLGNIIARLGWRYLVIQNWQKRKEKRLKNH